jgi:Holliday junction resolvase RusA-like endonuclease
MADGLTLWLPCVPPTTTHHSKRIVKVGGFSKLADSERLTDAITTLDALLIPYRPASPVPGPVELYLSFVWPWRKTEPMWKRINGSIPHTSRPDCSNLAKTMEDRLVSLRFIGDDACVSKLTVCKAWGDRPGIYVRIVTAGVGQ